MKNYIILRKQQEFIVIEKDSYNVSGLNIDFKGENNTVIINTPNNFSKSRVSIDSSNSIVDLGPSSRLVSFKIFIKAGNNQSVKIGRDFSCGGMLVLMSEPFSYLNIGEDCMLSSDIVFMVGDSHQIYDYSTQKIKNWSSGINVGNHVWIGRSARLVSGADIGADSIVGFGSLVTKRFDKTNVSIGGVPARVLSEGVTWKRPFLQVEHDRKASLHKLTDLSFSKNQLQALLIDEKDEKWKKKIVESYELNKQAVINNIELAKESKEYSSRNPEVIGFIFNRLMELGFYDEIVLEFRESEKHQKITPVLTLYCIKALLKLDLYLEAKKYFHTLSKLENIYDYIIDILDILLINTMLWDKDLFPKEIYDKYILNHKEVSKSYFYLLMKLESKYELIAMDVADNYLEHNMDLKFFVDYFDLLVEKERYSIAIEYVEKFLVYYSNSAWLFKKLIYLFKLEKDMESLEETYQRSVFNMGNEVYIFRYFIEATLELGFTEIAKKYLVGSTNRNFDYEWGREKIRSI